MNQSRHLGAILIPTVLLLAGCSGAAGEGPTDAAAATDVADVEAWSGPGDDPHSLIDFDATIIPSVCAPSLLPCREPDRPCHAEWGESSGNPPPYDECGVGPFYDACPNDDCVPDDNTLELVYAAWFLSLPAVLGIPAEAVPNHVCFHGIGTSGGDTFWIDFLAVVDWAIVDMHYVFHSTEVPPSSTDVLVDDIVSVVHYPGSKWGWLPLAILSEKEVVDVLAECHPDAQLRQCTLSTVSKFGGSLTVTDLLVSGQQPDGDELCTEVVVDVGSGEIIFCDEFQCAM